MTDPTRQAIYDAFELTPAEIKFIESDADGYLTARRQADEASAYFRDVVLPARIRQVEVEISKLLPDGYEAKFDML